ncbi:MAG: 3-isopropylmalate dehydratase large subunit [Elusimicrobia bacterium]|nr:3-isopropylmalate dehydratase large subunit [Elusimicrobiota bacterium]MBU2614727.1 3-isopropylmalate dehydratase large subunit [Elusimicrobiota bacterium]
MKQTITQKILAKHSGKKEVHPGEFIDANVDIALGNDITAPLAIKQFREIGVKSVFDKNKVVIVQDHFTPNKDIKSAEQCKFVREFAHEQKLKNFFDCGSVGIEHVLLPEQGLVGPGQVVIGADSHTCTYGALGAFSTGVGSTDLAAIWSRGKVWLKVPETIKFVYKGKRKKWVYGKDLILYTIGKIGVDGANYKSMEFTGEVIRSLPMPERLTMSNMAIEAGGKNGIIEPDEITLKYEKSRFKGRMELHKSDADAQYCDIVEIDVSKMDPQVALPHLPENSKSVKEVKNITIDQSVIGSCTNGHLEDLEIAAKILKGKKVHPYVRLLIFPATPAIYMQAIKKGYIETFIKAGGIVNPPTCGPCLGGHLGILTKGERCIATTNRNFVGRMGDLESEVYLSNPAVAAASAIKGKIAGPEEV